MVFCIWRLFGSCEQIVYNYSHILFSYGAFLCLFLITFVEEVVTVEVLSSVGKLCDSCSSDKFLLVPLCFPCSEVSLGWIVSLLLYKISLKFQNVLERTPPPHLQNQATTKSWAVSEKNCWVFAFFFFLSCCLMPNITKKAIFHCGHSAVCLGGNTFWTRVGVKTKICGFLISCISCYVQDLTWCALHIPPSYMWGLLIVYVACSRIGTF